MRTTGGIAGTNSKLIQAITGWGCSGKESPDRAHSACPVPETGSCGGAKNQNGCKAKLGTFLPRGQTRKVKGMVAFGGKDSERGKGGGRVVGAARRRGGGKGLEFDRGKDLRREGEPWVGNQEGEGKSGGTGAVKRDSKRSRKRGGV